MKPEKLENHWTLDEALKLIRALQPETVKHGYHLTLGGGLLTSDLSDRNLELYFLPLMGGLRACGKELCTYLKYLWGDALYARSRRQQPDRGKDLYEYVGVCNYSGLWINVFIAADPKAESLKPAITATGTETQRIGRTWVGRPGDIAHWTINPDPTAAPTEPPTLLERGPGVTTPAELLALPINEDDIPF
jgi:hypothetical protein